MGQFPTRSFATKKDEAEEKPKRKRATKAEMEARKLAKAEAKAATPKKGTRAKNSDPQSTDIGIPQKMYVLKFNSPILPFSKFPLT